MAYTRINFKTKKALKEAVAAYARGEGPAVAAYQPGPFGPSLPNGSTSLEGPHYPEPHRWYASAVIRGGVVVSVK